MYNSWFVCWDANNEQYKFQVDLQKCYNNLILTPPFFIYIPKIEKKSKKTFLINSVNSNNFVYFFHFCLILRVKLSFKKWKIYIVGGKIEQIIEFHKLKIDFGKF